MPRLLTVLLAAWLLAPAAFAQQPAEETREWAFRVLLDGKPIGTHNFRLDESGATRTLKSEAKFDVKFLFFTAYEYRHENTEEWSDGCLREIDARTNANGKKQVVSGEKNGQKFVVERNDETAELPPCIMTFAYWNPEFLDEPALLNPQTGEYLDVQVETLEQQTLDVRGESRPARIYRVTAKDTELKVWYSENDEWLALESVAKGGRILRYELI